MDQYVYTIDSDNIAHRIPVETGLVGDGETEITSGLSGGETLVTVGQSIFPKCGSPGRGP